MGRLAYRQCRPCNKENARWPAVGHAGWFSTLRLVKEFGLTGGIGSGKSTVSAMFHERGATIIDADLIVRELQTPGERVFAMMVERWGSTIVSADGTLNRGAVAEIVFNEQGELDALNAIVHPAVADETSRRLAALEGSDATVIHDIPLLVQPGGALLSSRDLDEWSGIIVVDAAPGLAVDRVAASRGLGRDEVEARQGQQASRDERLAAADFVIDNNGPLDALAAEVERCWQWMLAGGTERVSDKECS